MWFGSNLRVFSLFFSSYKKYVWSILWTSGTYHIYRNTKNFKNSNCLQILFYSLVRSKLEYCSLIWSPLVKHQSDQIERVQNKFLIINSCKFTSSHNSLTPFNYPLSRHLRTELNIQSLNSRRLQNDLIFLRKLVNEQIDRCEILHYINCLNITVDLSNPFFSP